MRKKRRLESVSEKKTELMRDEREGTKPSENSRNQRSELVDEPIEITEKRSIED